MNAVFELDRSYRFEAEHHLPRVHESHQSRRLHGHSYRVDLTVIGPASEQSGWVIDVADIDAVFKPLRVQLDRQVLNKVPGLENPTAEVLARWLWERLAPDLPCLAAVRVAETPNFACTYRGARER